MINNNLDYEKNSNRTTTTTATPSTPISIKKASRTADIDTVLLKSNSISSGSVGNNINNMMVGVGATKTATETTAPSTNNSNPSTNDNSYFNRFDNRIAANLAAVINGARFRSSSCSNSKTSKSFNTTTNNRSNINNTNNHTNTIINNVNSNSYSNLNSNSNSNSSRLNANNIVSNSSTNLHLNNAGGGGGGGVGACVGIGNAIKSCHDRYQHYHFNGIATTLGGAMRHQQMPPKHLRFNNVTNNDGNRSRSNSPLPHFPQCNRSDEVNNTASMGRRRPSYLFSQVNLNCNDNEKVAQTPSSDEDNSPTELNNCKRLADKPPLVKRLTMGLLRSHEESRPLVNAATPSNTSNDHSKNMTTTATAIGTLTLANTTTISSPKLNAASLNSKNAVYSYGYINDEAFEPEKFIASKFGDSCRQSLTAIPMLDTVNLNDNSEFNLKKRYLRETSSANSSPKIFGNRLRGNVAHAALYNGTAAGQYAGNNVTTSSSIDDDESDLKEACWFQAGISREIAAEVLSSKSPGAFLVRKSSSKTGCYALTLRVPSPPGPKIANYIILRTSRGYKINGFRKEFSSLKALITHHSVMPELLPIPLAMPRPTNMTSSRRNLDDFDTYDSLQMLLKYLRAKNLENGE